MYPIILCSASTTPSPAFAHPNARASGAARPRCRGAWTAPTWAKIAMVRPDTYELTSYMLSYITSRCIQGGTYLRCKIHAGYMRDTCICRCKKNLFGFFMVLETSLRSPRVHLFYNPTLAGWRSPSRMTRQTSISLKDSFEHPLEDAAWRLPHAARARQITNNKRIRSSARPP